MASVEISDMDVQKLLDEISGISEKYDLLHERTGEKFDIFKILDVYNDEKRVCRVLCELLSPEGSHCQGALYLRLFVRDVINKHLSSPLPESEFESDAAVDREFQTDGNRRVDLMIQTSRPRFIPIEVKTRNETVDQPTQCKDYFEEAKCRSSKDGDNVTLFYLTPWGKEPDDNSLGGLTVGKDVICISFAEDILSWLVDCLRQPETIRIAPVREVLQQFMKAIRGFTNQLEDDVKMEYVDVITKSSQNFKAALAIENSIEEAKKEKWKDCLEKVKEKVAEMGIKESPRYTPNGWEVCLAYDYEGMGDKKIEVQLGTHKNDKTYVSYYCENVKEFGDFPATVKKKYESSVDRSDVVYDPDHKWFYWERCHLEGQQNSPDFLNPNDAFYELWDDEKMEEFADVCAKKIKRFLDFRMS